MPDKNYKKVFEISANTHVTKNHDAVMLVVGSGVDNNLSATTPGASAAAFITLLGENSKFGAAGYPIHYSTDSAGAASVDAGATGGPGMFITAGEGDEDRRRGGGMASFHTILPVQIFSAGGVTGGRLYGLK